MRASRLLTILMLLQTRGRMSASALAAEVEVDLRTIYRDIDDLSSAGIPVYAERGRSGGFELLEGYRTKLTGLTRAEGEALFFVGFPGPAAELGLGDSSAAARLKLLAALPVEARVAADRVSSRFHFDPTPWYRDPEAGPLLRIVAEAVWATRRLRVRYESWDKIVERDLDPLGLVLKAGVWYLVARADRSVRTYRIAKVLEAAAREDSFVYPAGFDLAAHWKQAAKTFEESVYRDEAVLVVTERGHKLLRSRGAAIDRAVVKSAKPAGAGRWRVTIPIESVEQAARDLLSLGAEGEVISPAPLRAAIAAEAVAVAALYAKAGRKKRLSS
ncbi:MAG: WYL domain-containing protein [Alphaproteobacteria bacterium]|nr:WYL domain-containing protein [Alphaproteobacteria bacterium]